MYPPLHTQCRYWYNVYAPCNNITLKQKVNIDKRAASARMHERFERADLPHSLRRSKNIRSRKAAAKRALATRKNNLFIKFLKYKLNSPHYS